MARSLLFFMISLVSRTLLLLGDLELSTASLAPPPPPPCRGHLATGRGGGGCGGGGWAGAQMLGAEWCTAEYCRHAPRGEGGVRL